MIRHRLQADRSLGLGILRGVAVLALTLGATTTYAQHVEKTSAEGGRGNLLAQAMAYEHGEGVRKDPMKAAALYCESARDFDAEAQFRLGWMYANGRGVARDDAVAASLFATAAASGHEHAQRLQKLFRGPRGSLPECMRVLEVPTMHALSFSSPETPLTEFDAFVLLPRWKQNVAELVQKLSPRYAVDPRLALAVIAVESNFDPMARSPKDARGLMQLIPETAVRFNVSNPHDATDNLRGGLAYLRWLLAYYRGQVPLAAAAYNAGEAAVDRYQGIPPYPETREYVKKVVHLFRAEWHPYDARIVGASPMLTRAARRPL